MGIRSAGACVRSAAGDGELGTRSCIGPARLAAATEANIGAMGRFLANLRYQIDYNVQLFHARADGRRAVRRIREQFSHARRA